MINLRNIKIAFLSVVFSGMIGCVDLKENPDFINPDTFYQSASELELGVNALYDDLNNGNNEWFNHFYNRYVFESLVGYQVGWEKAPLQYNLGNFSSADDHVTAFWQQNYRSIDRANNILEIAETIEDPNNADKLERLKGEAHFLRAFYYYELLIYYDNAPVKTTATKSFNDLASNAGGKRALIDQIYADCNIAKSKLPDSYSGADLGRATKWAASTILMKAQLWDEKWVEAKATAEDIINNGGFNLFSDFSHNFDLDHENQGERIFEAQVSAQVDANEYNNHSAHFNPEDYPSSLGGAGWSWISATQDFRKSYNDNDKRISGTFIEEYPSGRIGRTSSGEFPIVKWSKDADYNVSRFGGLVSSTADPNNPEELIFGKAWSAKLVELGTNWIDTEKNTVYHRFAEVLLGHAEACNESGQGNPYESLNKVRSRAGLEPLSGLSKDELRDAIVDEFVHEFAFEQNIYPELRRKSKFGGTPDYLGDYIRKFSETYNIGRTPKAKDYVLPIPLIEIQGNPNVTQNSAWK